MPRRTKCEEKKKPMKPERKKERKGNIYAEKGK
jgi:hypothetical protein